MTQATQAGLPCPSCSGHGRHGDITCDSCNGTCDQQCAFCPQPACAEYDVCDDQGEDPRPRPVCQDCLDVEQDRTARIRARERRAALADYAALAEVGL